MPTTPTTIYEIIEAVQTAVDNGSVPAETEEELVQAALEYHGIEVKG